MPESFAQGRCLDHLMRNSMLKASSGYFAFCKAHREGQRPRCPIRRRTGNEDVAPPVWLNFARSSQSKFQETIVPRVIRVSHVSPRYQQSAKLLADAWLNSCAKLSKQISRNHCPTRHTRPTRPTSPFAKCEAQGLALLSAKREALSTYAASTIGLAVHFQLALRMRMPFSVATPLR